MAIKQGNPEMGTRPAGQVRNKARMAKRHLSKMAAHPVSSSTAIQARSAVIGSVETSAISVGGAPAAISGPAGAEQTVQCGATSTPATTSMDLLVALSLRRRMHPAILRTQNVNSRSACAN
jgi:hypothetical protein